MHYVYYFMMQSDDHRPISYLLIHNVSLMRNVIPGINNRNLHLVAKTAHTKLLNYVHRQNKSVKTTAHSLSGLSVIIIIYDQQTLYQPGSFWCSVLGKYWLYENIWCYQNY